MYIYWFTYRKCAIDARFSCFSLMVKACSVNPVSGAPVSPLDAEAKALNGE